MTKLKGFVFDCTQKGFADSFETSLRSHIVQSDMPRPIEGCNSDDLTPFFGYEHVAMRYPFSHVTGCFVRKPPSEVSLIISVIQLAKLFN